MLLLVILLSIFIISCQFFLAQPRGRTNPDDPVNPVYEGDTYASIYMVRALPLFRNFNVNVDLGLPINKAPKIKGDVEIDISAILQELSAEELLN